MFNHQYGSQYNRSTGGHKVIHQIPEIKSEIHRGSESASPTHKCDHGWIQHNCRVGNQYTSTFPITNGVRQGDALSSILLDLVLEVILQKITSLVI